MSSKNKPFIPLTVPEIMHETFSANLNKATQNSGKLFLFAADQKMEHLNSDFYGHNIPKECSSPEHLFQIASKAPIGAFATQLGLISQYGMDYKNINYVIKLNSKTNLIPTSQKDPLSTMMNFVSDVTEIQEDTGLNIVGVGYTIYLGSEYESHMLTEAAQMVYEAHQNGLLAILWIYPRGKAVKNELDQNIVAGAAGVGSCLGADFVKVNFPEAKSIEDSAKQLKQSVLAAGKTKVICAGGKKKDEKTLLSEIESQIKISGCSGCAIGRNIFQLPLNDAIKLCEKISKIVHG